MNCEAFRQHSVHREALYSASWGQNVGLISLNTSKNEIIIYIFTLISFPLGFSPFKVDVHMYYTCIYKDHMHPPQVWHVKRCYIRKSCNVYSISCDAYSISCDVYCIILWCILYNLVMYIRNLVIYIQYLVMFNIHHKIIQYTSQDIEYTSQDYTIYITRFWIYITRLYNIHHKI
jgi:hypothetical protein